MKWRQLCRVVQIDALHSRRLKESRAVEEAQRLWRPWRQLGYSSRYCSIKYCWNYNIHWNTVTIKKVQHPSFLTPHSSSSYSTPLPVLLSEETGEAGSGRRGGGDGQMKDAERKGRWPSDPPSWLQTASRRSQPSHSSLLLLTLPIFRPTAFASPPAPRPLHPPRFSRCAFVYFKKLRVH